MKKQVFMCVSEVDIIPTAKPFRPIRFVFTQRRNKIHSVNTHLMYAKDSTALHKHSQIIQLP